jgi:hypothetical protein
MTTTSLLTRTVIVFAALAVAGIILTVSSQFVTTALEQTIMVGLGSALFGASLCFFLVRLFSLVEK